MVELEVEDPLLDVRVFRTWRGLVLMPQALVMSVLMPMAGRIYDRIGARRPAVIGLSIVALSSYLMRDLTIVTSDAAADVVIERVQRAKRPGDVVVTSIHRGSNWGYAVSDDLVRFAHRLVDGGVDVVHGHSSHHPRPVEVYRGKLVLYGCGDLINDYEGIPGHEESRPDLRLLYFAALEPRTGSLAHLRIVPMRTRRMRLRTASNADGEWLRDVLDRESGHRGTHLELEPGAGLVLRR